jgi:hypothetical protein
MAMKTTTLEQNYDDEDRGYMTSRAFWEMIRERRKGLSVPLEKIREELLAGDPALGDTEGRTG